MLIRGGTIVTGAGEQEADILVRDGKVVRVAPGIAGDQDTIDASGLLVLPGVVDPHTHLLLDTGTARTADDFESGSASAAAGGVTTYLEFAPQGKGQTFLQALAARRRLMDGHSHVDYGVHLSTPDSVDLIAQARRDGVRAIAETCPHYLVLDESVYAGPDAARYLMTPPLRGADGQAKLWQQLADAAIHTIGSDHCGFALRDRQGIDDFSAVSPGIPGVETSLLLLYSFGVTTGRLRLPDVVRLLSEQPAKVFGLWPRKGSLIPGADADLVLYDPRPQRRLAASELHSRAGFSPYEGMTVTGRVKATVVRGRVVYRDGSIVGKPGDGIYQRCDPFDWRRAVA